MDLYFFIQATNTMFCGFLLKHILCAVRAQCLSYPIPAGGCALLYSIGWLVKLGFPTPPSLFAVARLHVTGLWRQCYIIPHGFTATERDIWQTRCCFNAASLLSPPPVLPSPSLLCSPFVMGTQGGLVKSIIYPCLHSNPPPHHHL